ncbi:MAG: hypothetical protein JTT14_02515, partial [Candidatus Brockarchaeota archaeon]|nr:hypothetical protein [Candidatus Brockarchaeota archaeon]
MKEILYTNDIGEKKDMQVKCVRCQKNGTLTLRQTNSKGITYHYYYVQHVEFIEGKRKTTWCYVGKEQDLPEEYKKLIHKKEDCDTQTYT